MSSSFVSNGASLEDCHCNLFCLVSAGAAGGGGGGRAGRPWAVGEGVRGSSSCRCPPARPRRSRPPRETASAPLPARTPLGRVLAFPLLCLVLDSFYPPPPHRNLVLNLGFLSGRTVIFSYVFLAPPPPRIEQCIPFSHFSVTAPTSLPFMLFPANWASL